jgi:hypothetical protein
MKSYTCLRFAGFAMHICLGGEQDFNTLQFGVKTTKTKREIESSYKKSNRTIEVCTAQGSVVQASAPKSGKHTCDGTILKERTKRNREKSASPGDR